MRNYRFAFHASSKRRTHALARALAEGARRHGDTVNILDQDVSIPEGYDGGACMGMAQACKRLFTQYREAGKHFLLFDKGYMHRELYTRVSINAWQPLAYFQRIKHGPERFDKILKTGEFRFLKVRETMWDDRILVAGVCQAHCNFHDLGNVNDYHEKLVSQISKYTDRAIVYRPNPSWYVKHNDEYREIAGADVSLPDKLFSDELERACCVVTHGSSAAFGAVAAGVPAMVMGEGIASPVAPPDLENIDTPYWPDEKRRIQFFNDVAYCQWTLNEYTTGLAWEHIRPVLASFEEEQTLTPDEVLAQYKMMHQSPKYFRGIGTVKYADEVKALIIKLHAETLLDYGSGKGVQYDVPRMLDRRWGVNVTCYDPAVPGIDKLPTGEFDAVICCDVLEHIPEVVIQETLQRIINYARLFVFLAIAVKPANKVLPDGRNCHVTVHPIEWWHEQIYIARIACNRMELVIETVVLDDEEEPNEGV